MNPSSKRRAKIPFDRSKRNRTAQKKSMHHFVSSNLQRLTRRNKFARKRRCNRPSQIIERRRRSSKRVTKRATGNNTSICKHLPTMRLYIPDTILLFLFFFFFFLSFFEHQLRVDRSCPRPRNHRHPCSVYRNGSEQNVFRTSACLSSNINRAHPCSQPS